MTRQMIVSCLGAFGGTLGYTFLLNAPRSTILPASLTALLGYVIYALLNAFGASMIFSYFFATVVISVICEIEARVMRMPASIFLLSALVPLVPGYNFYCAMLYLVEDSGAAAAAECMDAVQIVAAIAVGAAVTSVLFRTLTRKAQKSAPRSA